MRFMTGGTGRWHRRPGMFLAICFFVAAALAAGCGPSKEEIMAREQAQLAREAREREAAEARRQAEEARRQAEAAKREKIRAAEATADEEARQGRFDKALEQYREVMKKIPRYGEQDQRVRRASIKTAQAMVVPPTLPEDILRYMVRGEAKVKMGGAGSFEAAAQEMEKAVLEAPWFADGYFNLGTIQDKAGKFSQAIQNFQLFLIADPKSRNAIAVRAKIYGLEVKLEEMIKTMRLMGNWRVIGNPKNKTDEWSIRVKGDKLVIGDNFMQLEKKGLALEGFADFKPYTSNNCTIPGGRPPVTGTVSEDGARIDLQYDSNLYNTTSQGSTCIGVSLIGKERVNHKLAFQRPCPFCVDTQDLTKGSAGSPGMPPTGGVLITEVYDGGPADVAGLRRDDVIIACQGREVRDDATFLSTLKGAPTGSEVSVTFLRGGEEHDTVVKAGVYLGK